MSTSIGPKAQTDKKYCVVKRYIFDDRQDVQALKESVEMEEQIEEWERYENEKELYAQQQFHTEHFRVTADVSTSSEHHQPDMLMEKTVRLFRVF